MLVGGLRLELGVSGDSGVLGCKLAAIRDENLTLFRVRSIAGNGVSGIVFGVLIF